MVGLGFGSRADKNANRPKTTTENKVKVFYEGPDFDSDDSESEWVEDLEPPSLLSRAFRAMKKKSKSNAAIELYKRRSDDDDKLYIEKVRFDVRPLRDALKGVLEPDNATFYYHNDDTAESTSPHSALYFARHRITELSKMSDDDEVRRRCSMLRDVIQEIFLDKFEEIEALNREGAITFELLWTLFPPKGIYGAGTNPPRALRVSTYKQDHWRATIENETVMFGGFCFVIRFIDHIIPRFPGKMELAKLLPGGQPYLDLHQDNGKLRDHLIERGRKALDFQTARYMVYKPSPGDKEQSQNPWLAGQNSQRVVCDCYMNRRAPAEPLSPPVPMGMPGAQRPHAMPPNIIPPKPIRFHELPGYKDTSMMPMRFCRPTPAEMEINRQVLTESDENLLLMSPFIPSYNLDNNTWIDAEIDRLEPITQPDEMVLDRVSFDEDKKEILKTLVEHHKQFGGDQDDLIGRKGQALVIILEGDHGTGKKHMIKALAEQLACPLMRGPNRFLIASPNARLPHLLEQAAEWGALLMFDDPDFLAKSGGGPWAGPVVPPATRDLQDFLRRLESFRGIIFLTTDRQKNQINPSILSRADAHFTFPQFNKEESKQIWKTFLDRLPEDIGRSLPISSEALAATMAAKWSMNGHEIKHVVNLTATWCGNKNRLLDQEVLEDMIDTTCPSAVKVAAKKPPRVIDYMY